MWLAPYFENNAVAQDIVATIITFAVALVWLRLNNWLAARGVVPPTLSRKIIHIGTGPLFVLCWPLFSETPQARWFAALVPLAITAQFLLVGLGILRDPAAVQSMSRTGDRREILRGPLYYGIVFVICTVVFWIHSPAGITALMLMCGGDGLADIVGRRWGKVKLPWAPGKSWAGSLGMFVGSFIFAYGYLVLFNALGLFVADPGTAWLPMLGICLVGTIVESLPFGETDNLTVTAVAIGLMELGRTLGWWANGG